MLQRFVVPGLGSNTMLYLLSYECWAYLSLAAFFIFRKWDRRLGWGAAGGIAVVASLLAPEFFGYLMLWLMGLLTFLLSSNRRRRVPRGLALLAFAMALALSRWGGAHMTEVPAALMPVARMGLDLLFGAGFTLLIAGWQHADAPSPGLAGLRSLVWRLNRKFEGASVTLFATHFPFMMFVVASASAVFRVPIGGQPSLRAFLLFGATVAGIYCYAYTFAAVALSIARILRGKHRQIG